MLFLRARPRRWHYFPLAFSIIPVVLLAFPLVW